MAVSDDIELSELLLIFAVIGAGAYLIYKYLNGATCIVKPGTIPGVTGATTAQANAAVNASCKLKAGGKVVWSCGSDFDYLQPCNQIVTEARHNFLDYVPILNNFGSGPVKYTCVPVACYCVAKLPAQLCACAPIG
jgi:hypothetical protein